MSTMELNTKGRKGTMRSNSSPLESIRLYCWMKLPMVNGVISTLALISLKVILLISSSTSLRSLGRGPKQTKVIFKVTGSSASAIKGLDDSKTRASRIAAMCCFFNISASSWFGLERRTTQAQ